MRKSCDLRRFPLFFRAFHPFFRQFSAPFDYNTPMHPLLAALIQNLALPADPCLAAPLFLTHHGCAITAAHSQAVAAESHSILRRNEKENSLMVFVKEPG